MSADVIARGLASKARSDAATATTAAASAQGTANAALAGAAAKTANTAALITAIRNNGFFPQPLSRAPAANIPTVTLGAANAVSAINGRSYGNPLVLLSNSKLKFLAGPTTQDGNGAWLARGAWYGATRSNQYSAVETSHTGSDLEVAVNGAFYGATSNLRILVNDRIAAITTVPPSTGSFYYVRLTFPSSATRRIRIEGAGGKWMGINVTSAGELAATGRTYPLVTVMGDSFAEGTGSNSFDNEAVSLARALGGNASVAGVGATGMLNPGTGGKVAWTDATRLTDLTMAGVTDTLGGSTAPALGIVMASINDRFNTANWSSAPDFQSAINNAAWTIIDAWGAANPGKPLVFFGPTWTNEDPTLDIYRIRDGIQEACWGVSNVWFIDRLGPGPRLRKGANTFTSTTGNTTSGSKIITGIPTTSGFMNEAGISGATIPVGATVMTIDSATQVTISHNATATASGSALVVRNTPTSLYSFGPGDGTHPSQAGHNLDALWMAGELTRLIHTAFA